MKDLVLYCKSYHQDVVRASKLAASVRRFNIEQLPFYISCPAADLVLFKSMIGTEGVIFLSDEEIVAANPALDQSKLNGLSGVLSQQIVKSEFWRLGLCENYVCIDSDAYFIRDFFRNDFLAPDGAPYTVINESLELRLFGALRKHPGIAKNIEAEGRAIMKIMERSGKQYDFGPLPVVWSSKVWSDFATQFLEPRGINFLDAILLFPSEMRWYGEALLKYRSIQLWPVETLFRCYHYEEQYLRARSAGETDDLLKPVYMGVCRQSSWNDELAFGPFKRGALSKLARAIKRRITGRLT